MNVILIGYMGSGKTTIVKKLSKKLENDFYDLDNYIIYHEKRSIKTIFLQKTEKDFRDIESIILKNFLFKKTKYFLAVGGGTPCSDDNMYLMNQVSKTIYLKVNFKTLFKRLYFEKTYRTIIYNLNSKYFKSFLFKHFSNRNLFYEHANKKINIFKKSFEEIIDEIIN